MAPAVSVSGVVTRPDGSPASLLDVRLALTSLGHLGTFMPFEAGVTVTDAQGRFTILGVPRGSYLVRSRLTQAPEAPGASAGPLLVAAVPISVGDSDLRDIIVPLSEAPRVSGRVEFDGSAVPAAAQLARLAIEAQSVDVSIGLAPPVPRGMVAADGQFKTTGITTGSYVLRATGLPGWTVKAAMSAGKDISDEPFSPASDVTGVVVTLTDRASGVSGVVIRTDGRPDADAAVLAFPVDPARVSVRRRQFARVDPKGAYSINGLPAGEYIMIAIDDRLAADWEEITLLPDAVRLGTSRDHPGFGNGHARLANIRHPPGAAMTVTRFAAALVFTAVGVAATMAAPRQQPRARPATAGPQTGTAAIAGRIVTNDEAATPVRRALVTLSGLEVRHVQLSATDDEGRFVFWGLPAGRFTISAAKGGYVRQYYGATRPGVTAGIPVVVGNGQRADIAMTMTRSGVIAGSVLLPPGVPSTFLRVQLLRATTVDGERRLVSAGSASVVDSDGNFRIPRLMPGEYQLFVSASGGLVEMQPTTPESIQWAAQTAAGSVMATAPPAFRTVTFSPVFFPGTPRAAEAGSITVEAGQERQVTFALPLVPSARVGGQVVDGSSGQPPLAFQVWLVDEGLPVPRLSLQPRAERDGQFSTVGVTPGWYLLVARAARTGTQAVVAAPPASPGHSTGPVGDAPLWAMERVTINGDDLSNIVLRLQPGKTITGRVAVAPGASVQSPPRVRVSLTPWSTTLWAASVPAVETDAEGRFEIANVIPGRYRLDVAAIGTAADATRWAPQGAMLSGRDVLDDGLDVPQTQDVDGLVIAMTDRPTEFSAQILDSASRPITEYALVVFSTDPAHWRSPSRRVVQSRPGSDGLFVIQNLPPASTLVCAVTDVEATQLGDAAFLSQLVPAAFRITLAPGEKKRQDLRIGRERLGTDLALRLVPGGD